jgi:transcriptional regulator with XRE-family HTH domain
MSYVTAKKTVKITYLVNGAKLKARRNKLGFTQEELAYGLGVTSHYVCNLERGYRKSCSERLAKRLMQLLG